ncbi:MAG: AAA family ATPase [Firmicutes bacterium]|nr:AAA family ATPase [Bacillota bacterium]
MYLSFKAINFRCFHELIMENLAPVNLIAGLNNAGKTALLEALFLHSGAYNPELVMRINTFRGMEPLFKFEPGRIAETPWDSLFAGFDTTKEIELTGKSKTGSCRTLRLRVLREPVRHPGVMYIHPDQGKIRESVLSTETDLVLELEYSEAKRQGKHYLFLGLAGVRVEPFPPPPPPFPAVFLAARSRISPVEDAERYGRLEVAGKQEMLLKVLRAVEPRLRRLSVVVTGSIPMIYGDLGLGRLIPLPVMGEGMARLASIVLAIANTSNGVVLVDEVENGLHHSVLPKVWRLIGEATRTFNAQLFATTHSLECIEAAHRAFRSGGRYDFCLYRLENLGKSNRVITYDQETLEAALETDLEVR